MNSASAFSFSASSGRPASAYVAAESRRLRRSFVITASSSPSLSSRATLPATSSTVMAASIMRIVDLVNSSFARSAFASSALRRVFVAAICFLSSENTIQPVNGTGPRR